MKRGIAAVTAILLASVGAAAALTPTALTPLPQSFCSPVAYGGKGQPQVLVVSDLPLQGLSSHGSVAMTRAIRFVLAQHKYRAGRFTVGYQSCDDSNPQAPPGDLSKCAANAKAYAADQSVVGIVGTWNSQCSKIELPILNGASGGRLALISPSNSDIGLTRAAPGTSPGEPGLYYPTGKRNFARLLPADDVQSAAAAILAKRLAVHRMYVLGDKESYGISLAAGFSRAARRVGLHVAGQASWNPTASSFRRLEAIVKRAHAGGVYLAGFECPHCDKLIEAMRAAVGPQGLIVVGDAFSLPDFVKKSGQGLYGTLLGLPAAKLGPAGRAIARRFGPGAPDSGGPPYAAQAAEVLLNAIESSTGSRNSITAHLLGERVHSKILGSFRFDRNGDITPAGISIYRIVRRHIRLNRTILVPSRLFR
jgi:branched-chain amino acid transport system substrate-binding protein